MLHSMQKYILMSLDTVKHWTKFNEPHLMVRYSYTTGMYPPEHCSEPYENCTFEDSASEPYIGAHDIVMSDATAAGIYKDLY